MADERNNGRRRFLLRTGKAAALALVTTGAGLAFHVPTRRIQRPTSAAERRDLRLGDAAPTLAVARGGDAGRTVRAALIALGGMTAFVRKGETVVVKPNIGWDRLPEQAANTNPDLVRAVVEECFAAGAARVIVTDVSCNPAPRCFARSGIADAARLAGAEVIEPTEAHFRDIDTGGPVLGRQRILRSVLEADRCINIPVAKHHGLTRVTLGMKNLYGILGGNRSRLHQDIHTVLAELSLFLRPTLTIVDGIRILRRNGPQGGNPADVERHDVVAACTDPVAIDAWAAETLFGLQPDVLPFLGRGRELGLGTPVWRDLPFREVEG